MEEKEKPVSAEFPELAKVYLQEEQKQRRAEIENVIARIENDQKYGLLITGLIWSWLLTNKDKVQPPFNLVVAIIPPLTIAFFWWRWWIQRHSINKIARYTIILERHFKLPSEPEILGWETYLDNPAVRKQDRFSLHSFNSVWWMCLFLFNLALAVFYIWFTIKRERTT